MAEIDWEATARKAGWTWVEIDPNTKERVHNEPCLYHEDQDRIWPQDDWEGALRDLGFSEDDEAWANDIVYLPSANPVQF